VVEVASERALDAAFGFLVGLAGGEQALVAGGGFGVMVDALQGDHVKRPVELAVAWLSSWIRRAIRRSASVAPSGRGRSRTTVLTSRVLGTAARRRRRSSRTVTITASS
jgi:hypothetical protein